MSFSFASDFMVASVTGFGSGLSALVFTATQGSLFAGGRVGERFTNYFADADDLFLVAGVIEKELVALLHLLEMPARCEIPHASPSLTLCATLELIVPGIFLGFSLEQPISHGFHSGLSGRASEELDGFIDTHLSRHALQRQRPRSAFPRFFGVPFPAIRVR